MFNRKTLSLLVVLLLLAMLAVACGGGDGEEAAEEETTAGEEETAAEAEAVVGGDDILAAARNGDYDGEVVEIFGAFVDEDARRFDESMVPFEEATGIDVQYEGSGDFETLISVRLEGGDPPDIAAHPQPGLLAGFIDDGHAVPVGDILGSEFLEEHYDQGWIADSTFNDDVYGVWYRASPKSFVWYPKDDWDAAGYEIPTDWEQLIALSDTILEEQGVPPWCIGIESSGATGWVATDWLEDIMLRVHPPEVYDQWVAGEIDFDSPEVREAMGYMEQIWKNEDYVLGGTVGIQTTPFGDAPTPMFDEPPSCWLHRQASFITAFFPDDAVVGENVDFFYFPQIDSEMGEPVLTAGDLMAMYVDRPAVRAVMAYLATGESTRAWLESGGFVAPHKTASLDWYPSELDRRLAETLQNASVTRFDASDLMPGAVGAGSFWTGMTNWVGGAPLDEVLPSIDAAWPE